MLGKKPNVWDREHWIDPEAIIMRAERGVVVQKVDLPTTISEGVRELISELVIEAAWGKLKGPANLTEAASLLIRRLRRPISIGSIGCGKATNEKRLAAQRQHVSSVRACEVDYDTSDNYRRPEDNIAVAGIAGMSDEDAAKKVVSMIGDPDLLFFGDSLHHTPNPYVYLQEAVRHLPQWIAISEPFHMDYDGVTPEAGYLMDSTQFLSSMLSETGHKIWINWAILNGWKVSYIRLTPFPESSVMDDELERIFVILERPQNDEPLPYSLPENSSEDGFFEQWPISLLSSDERERVSVLFREKDIQPKNLDDFVHSFSLDGYQSSNPFDSILPAIEDKMHDDELRTRMQRAEIVFQIHFILLREFGVDLFERIYLSSGGSFKPRKLWLFEDGADGFEPFAIEKYYRERLRIKKVLDPRKYPKVSKALQAEITKLLKQDLLRLRKPEEMTAASMRTYQELYLRKPRVAVFEGLTLFSRRNHILSALLKSLGFTDDIRSFDVDYETSDHSDQIDANGVKTMKIGAQGLSDEILMDRFFEAAGETDFFVMNDGFQHLPDPFRAGERAYEALTPSGKLVVVSPYRFAEEEAVLHSLWPLYQTPYRDSMLTLEDQEIWINQLVLHGAKVEFARMMPGMLSPDNLYRIYVAIEKPSDDEIILTPWNIPHDGKFDMQRSAVEQHADYFDLWPYDGLKPEEKEKVRAVVGDLNSLPLSQIRGEIVFRLIAEMLDGEDKTEFVADKEGFFNGFAEGHDHYELLEKIEQRYGVDENLRKRFANNSCISLTCSVLRDSYGIDLSDYVERDLQWQESLQWKPWSFRDHCPEYEEMHGVVDDSRILMQMFGLGKSSSAEEA